MKFTTSNAGRPHPGAILVRMIAPLVYKEPLGYVCVQECVCVCGERARDRERERKRKERLGS